MRGSDHQCKRTDGKTKSEKKRSKHARYGVCGPRKDCVRPPCIQSQQGNFDPFRSNEVAAKDIK
jgi:hypothetical protein